MEEERKPQHKETQHSNFKRFNFSAHGPAMDECQTAPLPDRRVQQSWRFPQGKLYHLIIPTRLLCPAPHSSRGSWVTWRAAPPWCTHRKHFPGQGWRHWAAASALNQAPPPCAVSEGRQTPPEGQFTSLRYPWHRMNHQGNAQLYHSLRLA